ncbi:MAG: DAK2 domain-containing protein [Lachnospiraceae bacterium]|nr:DAK2 domain-containing protein [Lachnospiraceae bacterium]
MVINTIDGKLLQKMFIAGAQNIEAQKEYINELNVFPVPDGDTGTNMSLTIMSAANEVSSVVDPTLENLSKAISSGSLRGARGNSGVILSQLFRGFTKEIRNAEVIDVDLMVAAFDHAVRTAYKAVMKPKEGTILTVAKSGATKAKELKGTTDDLVYFGEQVLKHMQETLEKTPEMLPVLKEAGVVDSGGEGLMTVLRGAYDVMLGKEIDFTPMAKPTVNKDNLTVDSSEISTADIKFGYCTEFIINLEKPYTEETEADFKAFLESIGDSIVVVSDDDMVKVHVHTNQPGEAFTRALTYGSLSRMKVDNMREEHNERLIQNASKIAKEQEAQKAKEESKPSEPPKEHGFISVSVGDGIKEIFEGLNVDYLIEGGQTMNPSTEDVLNAIDKVNAKEIYIFPNNKNIILAAQQAKSLVEDKEIVVVPSKTIPQGIAAIINFMPDRSAEENLECMIEEMKNVKSGEVTYAVRDTSIDGKEIKSGNIMGINDDGIQAVGEEVEATTLELLDSMISEDSELISVYYGEDVSEETATGLGQLIEEKYPDVEVELYSGGQPIYYYLLSVE